MNFLTWLLYRRLFVQLHVAPAGASGGSSSEPSPEQLQQQVRETEAKLQAIQAKIDRGELVDPKIWIQTQIEGGAYFPKERYVGLQQTFQAEQEAHKTATGTIATLSTEQKDLQKRITLLEETNKTLTTQLQEKDTLVASLNTSIGRKSMIMNEFPQLAAFEAKGLLPPGEGDALKTLLSDFVTQLDAVGIKATESFAAGGGQRTPASTVEQKPDKPASPEDIQKLAFQKLREGNTKEYDTLMDQYYAEKLKEVVKA